MRLWLTVPGCEDHQDIDVRTDETVGSQWPNGATPKSFGEGVGVGGTGGRSQLRIRQLAEVSSRPRPQKAGFPLGAAPSVSAAEALSTSAPIVSSARRQTPCSRRCP